MKKLLCGLLILGSMSAFATARTPEEVVLQLEQMLEDDQFAKCTSALFVTPRSVRNCSEFLNNVDKQMIEMRKSLKLETNNVELSWLRIDISLLHQNILLRKYLVKSNRDLKETTLNIGERIKSTISTIKSQYSL